MIRIVILYALIALSLLKTHSFRIRFGAAMIPHPSKAYRGGEDAFYASEKLLVVADGVGGWNTKGVDPSRYSRFLCSASQVYFNEDPAFFSKNPLQLMIKAAKYNKNVGSSTMSVVTIDGKLLRTCHIGDCTLVVFRKYPSELISVYESVEQQHSFNYPFQLAMDKYGGDDPNHAICASLELKESDILVLGSDGLFDNIYVHEVKEAVEEGIRLDNLFTQVANKLAKLAIQRGKNPQFLSPFQEKALKAGLKYQGGKLDDTTVIIGVIDIEHQSKQENQSL